MADNASVEWRRGGKQAVLKAYLKLHENKLGAHWLWCAIERINAGESEQAVMEDFGYSLKSAVPAAPDRVSDEQIEALWFKTRAVSMGDPTGVPQRIRFARAVLSLRLPSAEWLAEHERLADNAIHAYAAWLAEFTMGDYQSPNVMRLRDESDAARASLMAHAASIGLPNSQKDHQTACSGRESSGGGE